MQKFIFVITSILILCLIGCSDVVGQGTGGAQDVITNQENNSASTNNEYDSPEREIEMLKMQNLDLDQYNNCLLYTSPSPRDGLLSRMPSSA